jgi:hypothetical protein
MSTNGRVIQVDDLAGQPCPRSACQGMLICKNSKQTTDGRYMRRFYACNSCGCRPEDNKRVIPIERSASRRTS